MSWPENQKITVVNSDVWGQLNLSTYGFKNDVLEKEILYCKTPLPMVYENGKEQPMVLKKGQPPTVMVLKNGQPQKLEIDDYVKELQKRLNELNRENLEVTGIFGDNTFAAVNRFKEMYILGNEGVLKGVVGGQKWKYLFPSILKDINVMNDPENVKTALDMLKIRLRQLGYDNGRGIIDTLMSADLLGVGYAQYYLTREKWDVLFSGGAVWKNKGSGKAISSQGIAMIANFELSEGSAKKWGIGEFDANGKITGIYPHYVFKNIGTQDNPKWISDGGITFGHGIYVTKSMYDTDPDIKKMVDKYAPGASFVPPSTPSNGVPYKVPNSITMPIAIETPLYETKLKDYEDAVNNFLNKNNITLKQNQFDALVSFTYNYGVNWWDKDKVMPNFIRDGKGIYDPEEVRRVFGMHDNLTRRLTEAEVFINGY